MRSQNVFVHLPPVPSVVSEEGTKKSRTLKPDDLGSNSAFSGCVTLGKLLHLSEPQFPFQS